MSVYPQYDSLFKQHKACVLIPTYNNAGTLADVINKVLEYTHDVIVVNDGSTDNTSDILKQFTQIYEVQYTPNKGKGYALRSGIEEAARLGYEYAIAMDSDGQHYPSDLILFLEQLDKTPGALIVGARNLNQENVQLKSSFGNKFSNFWFWVNTGITMPDTQSGYRCYPVQRLADKTYFTRKYEFEIEVMVRASWSGVPVTYIPISVYYPKPEERVSHFRPFKDFTRISILNTVLVLIAVLYIKPRDFFRLLTSREGWAKIWAALFIHPEESNARKAASAAFGIFMGIVPVWGFQLAIGIPLSILFRLNKTIFIIAANISFFPPIFWFLSLATGKWLLGNHHWVSFSEMTWAKAMQETSAFFLGGTVLAIAAGITSYLITFVLLSIFRGKK
jgi:glycosyltransferase involved in cell wall biosynthesis